MGRMRGLAICAALCATLSVAAEPVTLTPDQLRELAVQAVAIGDHARALSYTKALLRRDPDDVDTLVLRSRAARDANDLKTARATARAAWRAAQTKEEKYAAALVRAQALATDGARTQAQIWLRQAAEIAPTDKLRATALRDFRYVRARNPLNVQLSFSVAPVSNLNNGSIKDKGLYDFPFFGTVKAELGGAAKALSGIETAVGATLRYRLSEQATHRNNLLLRWHNRSYTLSPAAKKTAPNAKGSDFDFTSLGLTLAHAGRIQGAPGPYHLSLGMTQTWYGGEAYTRVTRVTARQDVAISKSTNLHAAIGFSTQEALGATGDAEALEYRVGLLHKTGAGHVLRFVATHERSASDFTSLDYTAVDLQAGLTLGAPVLGLGWEFGLSAGQKDHDGSPVRGMDRTESSYGASMTATLAPLEFYGFVPTVTVDARKVDANMGQYDREEFGLRLGLRSSF